jgi:Tfp pilus assembly PilM family ATPase
MLNFKKLKAISKAGSGGFVCINSSGDNLKLAHLAVFSGRKEIVNLVNHDIHGLSEPDISKVLKTLLSDLAIKNPYVINVIPSPLAITRNIEVPSQNPAEIEEIVNLQASRLTPYAREDIIIDYINVGTYRRNYTKLFLITVARNLIKRQLDILIGAGIKIERVCFSAEAIALLIPQFLKLESQDTTVNILHIDSNFTDFIIALKSKVIFVRGIPIGIEQLLAGREQYQLRFTEELKKSLEAYKVEDIEKSPQMIVLTGSIEKIKELDTLLNTSLRIPTTRISYLKHIPISEKEVSKTAASCDRMSFLDVIAPLIVSDPIELNLIPEEIKFKKLLEEKGRDIVKAGILVMGLFVLICAILITRIYFKSVYLKAINLQYNLKHSEAQELDRDFSRVQVVRNYLSHRGYSLAVLDALYSVMSRNVQLSDIKFDRQGKFSVRGSADSMGAVFSLIDDMGKTSYFKDVKSKYTTKRKEGDKDVVDFEIVSLLKEKD